MKRGVKTFICLFCMIALTTVVKAVVNDSAPTTDSPKSSDSPYSAIWMRNVFDLKPPAEKPLEPTNTSPPVNVQLKGIITFGGKRALVDVLPVGGKSGGKLTSYILSEGDRQGNLEIMAIDVKAGTVKIKNDGEVSTITFSTNTVTGPGNPASMVGGPGPQAGRPQAFGQRPGFNPGGAPMNGGFTPTPVRPVRGGNNYSQATPQGYSQPTVQPGFGGYSGGYAQPGQATASPGLSIPGTSFNQPPPQLNVQPTPALSIPEETIDIIAEHAIHQNDVMSPIIPPPAPGLDNEGNPIPPGSSANGSQPSATAPDFTPPPPPTPALGSRVNGNFQ